MLYGFDLSFNMIQVLKLESFLGNLRVIHLSNNSIHEIQPLTMAPLLKELNIDNNKLKGQYLYNDRYKLHLLLCRLSIFGSFGYHWESGNE